MGGKRYRKAAGSYWLSWFRFMILALERWKEEDLGQRWTLSKLDANVTYTRPCKKQLGPDQQYSAVLSPTTSNHPPTHPPSSPSLRLIIFCAPIMPCSSLSHPEDALGPLAYLSMNAVLCSYL